MRLVLNVLAHLSIVVVAVDFLMKAYKHSIVHKLNNEQLLFVGSILFLGICSTLNLVIKSIPIFSEVFQNISVALFLIILARNPLQLPNIIKDENE